ncbi:MAG: SDR family oxidoreductase [Clostridia bacterium]|nr:SDR family oxidoreductase [Clostridia bacterium]MDY4083291.1 SDR family oxidoreductase [Eubacteriales bacterium]
MKTAIITGASRGIGRATATLLAQNDYNVVINYNHSEDQAKALVDELTAQGLSAVCYKADVSDEAQAEALVRFTLDRWGKVDLLVNNAGISTSGLLIDMPIEQINDTIAVNLTGTIVMTQKVAKGMLSNRSGNIVNISSIWGEIGGSCEAVYSATKGGVIAFSKAMAKELGYNGIRVNCIAPGIIDTDMNARLSTSDVQNIIGDIPCQRIGRAEDIAKAVLWLASDEASYINGQVLSINGGWNT